MPRFYCDYCDVFLTHDSFAGRKQHMRGRKHQDNVRQYYMQFLQKSFVTSKYPRAPGNIMAISGRGIMPSNLVPITPNTLQRLGVPGGQVPVLAAGRGQPQQNLIKMPAQRPPQPFQQQPFRGRGGFNQMGGRGVPQPNNFRPPPQNQAAPRVQQQQQQQQQPRQSRFDQRRH